MGIGPGVHISDQSLRSVRHASNVALPAQPALRAATIWDAGTIPPCSSPVIRRLAVRVLEHADDDARTLTLLCGHNCLHPDCNSIRGTRPCARARRLLRDLPPVSADAYSVQSPLSEFATGRPNLYST